MDKNLIKKGTIFILKGLKIDLNDPNFKETPERVMKSFLELCRGLYEEPPELKVFPTTYQGMVVVKPIRTVGLCPHHLLPVEYRVYIGYIPNKKALGLSKLPRIVDWLAHRPVLHEQLTDDIVDYIEKKVKPMGIICVIEGKHSCMRIRGIKQKSITITSSFRGNFIQPETRNEFMKLIK